MSNSSGKSFVFFGTPYVASDTLACLYEYGFVPSLVVTSPDSEKGRGLALTPSETKQWAIAHGVPLLTPEKLNDTALEAIGVCDASYALVVAYGKLLPQKLIDSFPLGVLNIHYSLLPKYRGASPVEAALLHADRVTGVTIQKMSYELDAGDIIAQEEVAIEPEETTRELRARLVKIGAELLASTLPEFLAETASVTPQNHAEATFAKKIRKEEGLLTLVPASARENWNKYRAYAESPGTYFFAEKEALRIRVKIVRARFENESFILKRVIPEGKNEQDFSQLVQAGWKPTS